MEPDLPYTAIRLDTDGECPHCRRPILGLAKDRCGFCQGSLEHLFPELPSVRLRLAEMAPAWTPEKLALWGASRPQELAWALHSGHWRNLAWFVHETLWMGWGNGQASLRGRGRTMSANELRVHGVQIAGLGKDQDWIALRVRGERLEHPWRAEAGWLEEFPAAPTPFAERWTLVPTGAPDQPPACTVCGGPLAVPDLACHHCKAPATFSPGPWILVALHAEPGPTRGGSPSPFEASGGWGDITLPS